MRHRMTARVAWLLHRMQRDGVYVAYDRSDRDTLLRLYRYGDIERERTTDPARRHFRYYLPPATQDALLAVMRRRGAVPVMVRHGYKWHRVGEVLLASLMRG
jgi:hypothetical protein